MEKEKVEVLGMMFDKGTEPLIGALQRDKNGFFYGTTYTYDERNLENIKPYLEGGEKYIDEDGESNTYTFNKKLNMWVGRSSYIDRIQIDIKAGSQYTALGNGTIIGYTDDITIIFVHHYSFKANIQYELSTNIGEQSIKIGSVVEHSDSDACFKGVVNCKCVSEGKTYNGIIEFNGNDIFLKVDNNDITKLINKNEDIIINFCGKIEKYYQY